MADRVIKLRDGQIRKDYVNEEKIPAMGIRVVGGCMMKNPLHKDSQDS